MIDVFEFEISTIPTAFPAWRYMELSNAGDDGDAVLLTLKGSIVL